MPVITDLCVEQFRNIKQAQIQPAPGLNLICGSNGAGKTSLLEAIYYLSTARSFRTNAWQRLLHDEGRPFVVSVALQGLNEVIIPAGVVRGLGGVYERRLDHSDVRQAASLAQALPVQFISAYSAGFFVNGPAARRPFLDWVAFHVEPSFHACWQQSKKLLMHRNSLLKARAPRQQLVAWEQQWVEAAEKVDSCRLTAFHLLEAAFDALAGKFLPGYGLQLGYQRGWRQEDSLLQVLSQQYERDSALGYTQSGPQRCDLQVLCENLPAKEVLSQGQLKVLVYAIHLAQAQVYSEKTSDVAIYLVDDMMSELDDEKSTQVAQTLLGLGAQVFATAINPAQAKNFFQASSEQMFHVKHGCVQP